MADSIDYTIIGDDMQIVEIELDPGEGVRAEAGAMMYMVDGIEMQTSTGGGLFKGFKRIVTGESFFITTFLHNGSGKGHVAFGAPYPGKIIPLDLDKLGGSFLCQKDAFLCAARGVEIEVAFTKKIGAGILVVRALFCSVLPVMDVPLFMRAERLSKRSSKVGSLLELIRDAW